MSILLQREMIKGLYKRERGRVYCHK